MNITSGKGISSLVMCTMTLPEVHGLTPPMLPGSLSRLGVRAWEEANAIVTLDHTML